MKALMAFTGKSKNTIKKRFDAMPVRGAYVPNVKAKFYKIDWGTLRTSSERVMQNV